MLTIHDQTIDDFYEIIAEQTPFNNNKKMLSDCYQYINLISTEASHLF